VPVLTTRSDTKKRGMKKQFVILTFGEKQKARNEILFCLKTCFLALDLKAPF
jgi:hypothetical protein